MLKYIKGFANDFSICDFTVQPNIPELEETTIERNIFRFSFIIKTLPLFVISMGNFRMISQLLFTVN